MIQTILMKTFHVSYNIKFDYMNYASILFCLYRYRNGIRGRMKQAVQEMLKQYYDVESQFQQGNLKFFMVMSL